MPHSTLDFSRRAHRTELSAGNLVIGGGPAGSMVAMRLAAAGCAVTLLEKERMAHHKVCGEFLSREAVEDLRLSGIDPPSLGARAIRFVRFSSKGNAVESALPFTAYSLSRFALDEAMLTQAARAGCRVERGVAVEGLARRGNLWCAELRNGEPIAARTVFLACGKHELRGWSRSPCAQSGLVAFKMHWQLEAAQTRILRNFIELFLFPGGYGGITLVEAGIANLCLVVRRERLRRVGGWTELLAMLLADNRHMRERLHGAMALWKRPLALSSIPYGYLAAVSSGAWLVGDQAAVIPSFTGDGMSIALHSARLAAEMYLAGETPENFSRRLHDQLNRTMFLSVLLSRVMVHGLGRSLAPLGLSLFPRAMRWIAASTRIPEQTRKPAPGK